MGDRIVCQNTLPFLAGSDAAREEGILHRATFPARDPLTAPVDQLRDILADLVDRDGTPGNWTVLDSSGERVWDEDIAGHVVSLRHIASVTITDGEAVYTLALTRR